jgi:uncharacterized UPF0160 family protein
MVGTHSGSFHADDVLAFALIRRFVDESAGVVRTRDREKLVSCDIVVDVGGEFDPATRRFDHHQGGYRGPRSSAGMVLDWLEAEGRVDPELATLLRERMVDYIDAVDTGREAPRLDVPCFARIVETMGQGMETAEAQAEMFVRAADIGVSVLKGFERGLAEVRAAREDVRSAMAEAVRAGRSTMVLARYLPWKPIYFELGGESHPTDYVLFPSEDETWKVVAVPPQLGCFEQKRSLPASWGGLMGAELEAATGEPGALFCHKNRFIAVFRTQAGALSALDRFGLLAARPAESSAG